MAKTSVKEYLKDHADVFAAMLGLIIFYHFVEATNEAIQSFLWLFSSIIVIFLMLYVVFGAYSNNTAFSVKFVGTLIFLLAYVFTQQVIISLFEPKNIYSLHIVQALLKKEFWINNALTAVAVVIFGLVLHFGLQWIKKKDRSK